MAQLNSNLARIHALFTAIFLEQSFSQWGKRTKMIKEREKGIKLKVLYFWYYQEC